MTAILSSEPHILSAANEYRLTGPPTDCISSIQFSPDVSSRLLLVSSWDTTVRLYDVGNSINQSYQRASYSHSTPVLCATFLDPTRCASGGTDNLVKMFDFNTNQETPLGYHTKPIRCIEYCPDVDTILSGSWDCSVKMWDSRCAKAAVSLMQPDRVYTMTMCGNKLIVGTASRKIWVWDVRQMNAPEQRRESSLKYQTRCIRAFPNRQGFVVSSIEGRVAVEYFDPDPESQKAKYAFKCHRIKEGGQEFIYPVNAIAFHPQHNTFATGGSDSLVNIWDPFNKKRLCQFHKYTTCISNLAFNRDGSLLAIAASYNYEYPEHPNPIPEDQVFIRKVTDQETKPKS